MRARSVAFLLLLLALPLAGCGSGRSRAATRTATLMLDFTPNAVHAGIYAALAHHYDRIEHLRLKVLTPSATTDSIKLLEAGKVSFAVLDIHDLAIARERGADIVGIMALVQRPLAAVIAAPAVRTPRDLDGRLVGITGVPSDSAVLRSVVAGAGGIPSKVRTITIGFNAVPALLAGRVQAATAFWNDEGVTLALRRPGFHSFKVDQFGAPAYPELVVCAAGARLRRDPRLAGALVRTLVLGYEFAVRNPSRSARDLESYAPGLDPKLVSAELSALLPAFRAADGAVGELAAAGLRRWADWEMRFGIVRRPPDVAHMFDPQFAETADSAVRGQ